MRKRNARVQEGLAILKQGISESIITVVSERVGHDFETVQDMLLFHPKPIAQTPIDELVEFFKTNYHK